MTENEKLLERLEKLLKWKKSKKFYSEKLNISETEVDELLKELRNTGEEVEEEIDIDSFTKKVNTEKGTIESVITVDFEPKDELELAKLHKIDLDKYIITNYWSKLKENGKFTSSVFSKKKKPEDYSIEDFSKFLTNYSPPKKEIIKENQNSAKEHIDVELSISDFHLAKKYIEDINNIKERAKIFFNIAKDLIDKSKASYYLNTVVFPISNDFFHTDNIQNSTTNGTPQDVIAEFDSEYEIGFDLLVKTINMLQQNANDVKVILVQGNHDRTKSFYLAHALEIYFKNELDVSFIRHHSTIKGVVLGNTFIGYHHGNCKIDELPLLFATDPLYSSKFGDAKYREIHTGDKHHYMAKEIKGVRIQQMPSLSGTDRWHRDNNYVNNIRAALLIGYNPKEGKCCEFEKRI